MRILIINFRHLGDALLTTPLVENLLLAYPNAKIDYLVNSECEAMVSGVSGVDKIWLRDRAALKTKGFLGRIFEEFRLVFDVRAADYDMVINTTAGERGAFVAFFSGATQRVGWRLKNRLLDALPLLNIKVEPPKSLRHVVEQNLDLLRAFAVPIVSKKVRFAFSKEDEKKVGAMLSEARVQKFVQIHPTSRWFFKCLPDDKVAEIIDFIELELGTKTVLTASPSEKELQKVQKILSFCKSSPANFAGKLSLKELGALSSKAALFFGVDSAPMHIAAAVDAPVVAVFGPSGAFNWGPWDNDNGECGYTDRNGLQSMGRHAVVQVAWECAPCGQDGCDGSKVSKCLVELETELIKKILAEKLAK